MRREWLAAINGIHHPDAVLLHGAGFAGRISLLLDDRITHAGTLSGEYGCCPKSSQTERHGYPPSRRVRSGDRAIRAARGWGAEVRGPRGCSGVCQRGADVLISYLGSEEVDADETVR